MKLSYTLAGAMATVSLLAAPTLFASETPRKVNLHEFMQACDMNHDGMMTKAQMLAHMGQMFDQAGATKANVPDTMQTEQLLRNITLEHN